MAEAGIKRFWGKVLNLPKSFKCILGALCRGLRILIPARPPQVFRAPLHDLVVLRVCATTII